MWAIPTPVGLPITQICSVQTTIPASGELHLVRVLYLYCPARSSNEPILAPVPESFFADFTIAWQQVFQHLLNRELENHIMFLR